MCENPRENDSSIFFRLKQNLSGVETLVTGLLAFSFSIHSWATPQPIQAPCEFASTTYDQLQVSQTGSCYLQVTTRKETGTKDLDAGSTSTRNFVFSSDGQILVFNSVEIPGETSISRTTGSRTYFVFPRKQSLQIDDRSFMGRFRVILKQGAILEWDTASTDLKSSWGLDLSQSGTINLQDQGGIELSQPTQGLLMDCGWAQSRNPIENSRGSCILKDRLGKSCTLPNTTLFHYVRGKPPLGKKVGPLLDVLLKTESDEALAALLKTRCPQLDPDWMLAPDELPESLDGLELKGCTLNHELDDAIEPYIRVITSPSINET